MLKNSSNLRFIFTGGGSGGHVSPALAVAAELKKKLPDAQIIYAGIKGKAEGIMVPKAGIPLKFVNSAPMPGKNPVKLLKFFITMSIGFLKALIIVLRFRPHLVFATGGYVSAPIIFATAFLRKITLGLFGTKILIHESNVHPGKMNMMAARAADAVAVSFSETISHLPAGKGFFSGYPVRNMITQGEKLKAREALGISERAFTVFAFGGSQGARTINRTLANAAPQLLKDPNIYIIHGTGKPFGEDYEYHGYEDVMNILKDPDRKDIDNSRYTVKDFIDNMELYYAASDLLIIRAGAGSIMEVCNLGKPSVIIPISGIFSDHQTGNARYIERAGAAAVLYEKTDPIRGISTPFLEPDELVRTIFSLKNDPSKLSDMSKKASAIFPGKPSEIIVSHILYLCGKGDRPETTEGSEYQNDRILGLDSNQLENFLKKIKSGKEQPLDDDEMRLLRNKIDTYFTSSSTILRSRALRIAGLAKYCELFPLAVKCAVSSEEKPFVRRDAFESLWSLIFCDKSYKQEVIKAAVTGLSDPYYETRFYAAKLVTVFSEIYEISSSERKELLYKLYHNFNDRCFEVRMESVKAAASIETDGTKALENLKTLYFDKVWKVRKAVFKAFEFLVRRGMITGAKAIEEFDKVLITSNGYVTEYELKKQFNISRSLISGKEVK
jgi:UDP-N-acetylglucosamine--N-acetylmuramyl-(pentapeptide) pyrophosphoryl-undecaprenol N-acetylglucosamine transferase